MFTSGCTAPATACGLAAPDAVRQPPLPGASPLYGSCWRSTDAAVHKYVIEFRNAIAGSSFTCCPPCKAAHAARHARQLTSTARPAGSTPPPAGLHCTLRQHPASSFKPWGHGHGLCFPGHAAADAASCRSGPGAAQAEVNSALAPLIAPRVVQGWPPRCRRCRHRRQPSHTTRRLLKLRTLMLPPPLLPAAGWQRCGCRHRQLCRPRCRRR